MRPSENCIATKKKKIELTTDLIYRALKRDPAAIQDILAYYESYIDAVSVIRYEDEAGNTHEDFDKDAKAYIQQNFLSSIPKFKGLFIDETRRVHESQKGGKP